MKKKTIAFLLLTLMLLCAFCSCGESKKEDLSLKASDLIYQAELGGEFTKEKADSLGSYEYAENQSCGFDGLDKIYSYENFEITTFPSSGKDYVLTVELKEGAQTSRSIKIGSSLSELTAAYGESYTKDGNVISYALGDASIDFTVKNDVVKYIVYSYNAAGK